MKPHTLSKSMQALAIVIFCSLCMLPAWGAIPPIDARSACHNADVERGLRGNFYRTCVLPPPESVVPIGSLSLNGTLLVERFDFLGQLDTTWGNAGLVTVKNFEYQGPLAPNFGQGWSARSVFELASGRVLVLGGVSKRFRAFTRNGAIDVAYGNDGISDLLAPVGDQLVSLDVHDSGSTSSIMQTRSPMAENPDRCVFAAQWLNHKGRITSAPESTGLQKVVYHGLGCTVTLIDPSGHFVERRTVTALSLRGDATLDASYFTQRANNVAFFSVKRQNSSGMSGFLGQAFPSRAQHYRRMDELFVRTQDDGDVLQASSSEFVILSSGHILLKQFLFPPGSEPFLVTLQRFQGDGIRDDGFGDGGISTVNLGGAPAGCITTASPIVLPQPDGSIVVEGRLEYFQRTGRFFKTDCPNIFAKNFAVKIDSSGKLAPDFPQLLDPSTSGAQFTRNRGIATAVEFYNPTLNRYFMTPNSEEADYIDRDLELLANGWWRTGKTFGVWDVASNMSNTHSACRFAADPIIPPKSFFDSIRPDECDVLRVLEAKSPPPQRAWRYDRESFRATPADNGTCPSTLLPIYALYNRGFEKGIDPNFRYVASLSDFDDMITRGWVGERRAQFCARPD